MLQLNVQVALFKLLLLDTQVAAVVVLVLLDIMMLVYKYAENVIIRAINVQVEQDNTNAQYVLQRWIDKI